MSEPAIDLSWIEQLSPQAAASLLTDLEADASREACEKSLAQFVRESWPILEPGRALIWNWHIDVMCAYLEAVAYGKIKDLMINVPPGTMKSTVVSVDFPAWLWALNPTLRFLCGTNDQALASRDSLAMRTLITSDWYQKRWGQRFRNGEVIPWVQIHDDQDEKTLFMTSHRGHRQSISMLTKVTGKRGDLQLIDDPHDTQQVESEVKRKAVTDKWDAAWSTRVNDLGRSPRIIVMQRQHVSDLCGHNLAAADGDSWTRLVIPMRYEGEPTYNPEADIGRPDLADPRTEVGELLFAERFPEAAVAKLETQLGEYGAAGQLQQRPHPKGGGEFREEWIMRYQRPPKHGNIVIIVDPAGERRGARQKRDWTAIGVYKLCADHNYYLIDGYRDRLGLAQRTKLLFQLHQKYSEWGKRQVKVGYEAYGKDTDIVHIRSEMERNEYRFRIIELGAGDSRAKEDRIRGLQPVFEAQQMWLPLSLTRTLYDGTTVDIIDRFIEEEYKPFPVGKFDDFFDQMARLLDPALALVFPKPDEFREQAARMGSWQALDPGAGY